MNKITYRELQRMSSEKLIDMLPLGVTVDSQGIAIVLSVDGYKKLCGRLTVKSDYDVTVKLYNPATDKPGDKVLVRPIHGKSKKPIEITVPNIDDDGNPFT